MLFNINQFIEVFGPQRNGAGRLAAQLTTGYRPCHREKVQPATLRSPTQAHAQR
jgi:hypothetical protein